MRQPAVREQKDFAQHLFSIFFIPCRDFERSRNVVPPSGGRTTGCCSLRSGSRFNQPIPPVCRVKIPLVFGCRPDPNEVRSIARFRRQLVSSGSFHFFSTTGINLCKQIVCSGRFENWFQTVFRESESFNGGAQAFCQGKCAFTVAGASKTARLEKPDFQPHLPDIDATFFTTEKSVVK